MKLLVFLGLALVLMPTHRAQAKPLQIFDSPYAVFEATAGPNNLALGDFNHDGHLDVVTSSFGVGPAFSGTISVFLGLGDGSLCTPRDIPAGSGTVHLSVDDFDRDGLLDVVAINRESSDASVMLGLGDGTLSPASTIALASEPRWSAAGDVTGDGVADVVVATDGGIVTLLNDGSGGFSVVEGGDYVIPRLAIGDLNGDGRLDVVTGAKSLLGRGDGTFEFGAFLDEGWQGDPRTVSLGDFDGDGVLDVASMLDAEHEVAGWHRGRGDGTFEAPVTAAGFNGGEADYTVFGDLDGSGAVDIAVRAGGTHWGVATVFSEATTAGKSALPESAPILVGDLDGDGFGDVVSTFSLWRSTRAGVAVYLGNGDGTFGEGALVHGWDELDRIAAGDMTSDGVPDVMVLNGDGETLFYVGKGDGTFAQDGAAFEAFLNAHALVIGDVDRDGHGDLIATENPRRNRPEYRVRVLLGDGVGHFVSDAEFIGGSEIIDIGDLDGDGGSEQFIVPNEVRYSAGSRLVLEGFGRSSARVDVDHDGLLDELGMTRNSVSVKRGRGAHGCGVDRAYGVGLDAYQFAVSDLDGDGAMDLVVSNTAWQEDGSGFSGFTPLINRNLRPLAMGLEVKPNRLVANSRNGGRWISAFLEPADGTDPNDIDLATVRLNGSVPIDPAGPTAIEDRDGDGQPELMVKFDRAAVALSIGNVEKADLIVTGDMSEDEFAGRDEVHVVRGRFDRPAAGEVLAPGAPFRVMFETSSSSPDLLYSPQHTALWVFADVIDRGEGWIDWRVPIETTEAARLALVWGGHGLEESTVLAVSDDFTIRPSAGVPGSEGLGVQLAPVRPNPSHGAVTIRFHLPQASSVQLEAFDLSGRRVATLASGERQAGWQEIRWARQQSSPAGGLFFVRLQTAGVTKTQRMLLLDPR